MFRVLFLSVVLAPLLGCATSVPRRTDATHLGGRAPASLAVFPPAESWDETPDLTRRDASLSPRSAGSLAVADAWDLRGDLFRPRRVTLSRTPWSHTFFQPRRDPRRGW